MSRDEFGAWRNSALILQPFGTHEYRIDHPRAGWKYESELIGSECSSRSHAIIGDPNHSAIGVMNEHCFIIRLRNRMAQFPWVRRGGDDRQVSKHPPDHWTGNADLIGRAIECPPIVQHRPRIEALGCNCDAWLGKHDMALGRIIAGSSTCVSRSDNDYECEQHADHASQPCPRHSAI
jgi:hypothetical protein